MARGPRRGVATLLISLVVVGCSAASSTPTTPAPVVSTSTSSTTTTTTTIATTTTTVPTTTTSAGDLVDLEDAVDAEITIPVGDGPFPAVVLVHGGGWVGGSPSIMRPLASFLADEGFLVVNTRYRLATFDRAGFPEAVEDVACAVRLAAAHPDSDGTVAVIGHSAGAHIGAIVALTGDDYQGDCPLSGTAIPERFVGLAGPYDISRIGFALVIFFGGPEESDPEAWVAGNPQLLTDENPDLEALIMYGEFDGLVDDRFAGDFWSALDESGAETLLELVEGATHNEMHDPDLVGDLIATWLDRPTSS